MPAARKAIRETEGPSKPVVETKLQKKRRATFLKAAAKVFLEKGYEAASMEEIIARAGGSKATLYAYFENKDGLFEAVMREELGRRTVMAFDTPDESGTTEQVLVDFGTRFVRLLIDDTSRALWVISMHDATKFRGVGRTFYESGPQVVHERIAGFLQRANEKGDLRVPDPLQAAEQLCMLCQAGLILPYLLRLIPKPSPEVVTREVEAAVRVFISAYGLRPALVEKAREEIQATAGPRPLAAFEEDGKLVHLNQGRKRRKAGV